MNLLRPTLAASLGLSVTAFAADSSLTSRFAEPLADALKTIRMTRSDLTFRTDHTELDSFRLSLMDRALVDPLGTLDQVQDISAALQTVDEPVDLTILASSWLDLDVPPRRERLSEEAFFSDTLWFGAEPNPLFPAIRSAESLVFETFATFHPEELDSLSEWAQTITAEEEQPEKSAGLDIFALRNKEQAERERARYFLALAATVNRGKLFAAAQELFIAARRVRDAAVALSPEARDTIQSKTWDTPLGRIAIGGTGRDRYTGKYALIVDYGGDDEYVIEPPDDPLSDPVEVVIDVSGNDRYEGHIASGLFGIALLMELAGDDVYRGDVRTQGAGVFGIGVLWDEAGDDLYRARTASQGVGCFGLGALVDLAGRDIYQIGNYGQALGATAGIGILDDRGGNDTYLSGGTQADLLRYDDHYLTMAQGVGLGLRPVASGGIGILSDRLGNDTYVADIFGQGVGYWFGIGGLVDEQGHDRYTAYQYAQGSGVHLAAGVLIDRAGNDLYVSNGVAQGCGHDLSVGILFDESGDDDYVTDGLSLGAGNANAISLFVDMAGQDDYLARRPDAMGYSDERREYGMVGVMLDLGGEDRYAAPLGEEGGWWAQATYGVGVDRAWTQGAAAARQPDAGIGKSPDEIARELRDDADSLFVQASNPVAAFHYLVDPAEQKLASRGAALAMFWAGKLGTENARERHALVSIHQKLFAARDTGSVPMLLDSLDSPEGRVRRLAAYLLGFSQTASAVLPLAKLLSHADWQTRLAAAESLWRLKDTRVEEPLIAALNDSVALVRHGAALALQQAGTSRSDPALVRTLSDRSQIVRHSAERALAAHSTSAPLLADLIMTDTSFAALHALRAVRGQAADSVHNVERATIVVPVLFALGDSMPWTIRAEAAETAAAWRMTEALPALVRARQKASHPYLTARLDAALRMLTEQTPTAPPRTTPR